MRACGRGLRAVQPGVRGLAPAARRNRPPSVARADSAARRPPGAITLVSVQGTFNMSHPDAEYRRAGLRRLRVLAAACRPLGTSMIGICTGTRDRQNMWRHHPDNRTPEAWRDMTRLRRARR